MNQVCADLAVSRHWYRDIVSKLGLSVVITASALQLFFLVYQTTNPHAVEDIRIDSEHGCWLFCALLLCHKYAQDDIDQLNNLVHIKVHFFPQYYNHWVSMELHYLEKITFRMDTLFQSITSLDIDSV